MASVLRFGSRGEEVKKLQRILISKGYDLGWYGADGKFGKTTLEAVKDFQKKSGLSCSGIVDTKTWAALLKPTMKDSTVLPFSKPKSSDSIRRAKVTFAANITQYRKSVLDPRVIALHEDIGTKSRNYSVIITSTIRTPEEQANAMYNNEKAGYDGLALYAAAGDQVIMVYRQNKHKPKAVVQKLMVDKINELSKQGQRVSLHCVPESIYRLAPIIDISMRSMRSVKDYVNEAIKRREVTRVIVPIGTKRDYGNSSKVIINRSEPAIHVEHKF